MIVDIHTHFWDIHKHGTDQFNEEAKRASKGKVSFETKADEFLRAQQPCDRTVVFGGKALHVGLNVPNEYVFEFCKRDPKKLVPFMSLDPNERGMMDEFERCLHQFRMRGIKLLPMYANFDPRDERLTPVYEAAVKHNLPVLLHMGTTFCRWAPLRYTRPVLLEEVAEKFPDLKMILAHIGHPYEGEAIVLIRKQDNIWSDISALHYRPWQFFNSMMLAQEYGVQHKLLFGSDYPFTTPEATLQALRHMNDMTKGTNLPKFDMDAIEGIVNRDSLHLLGIS